MTLEESEKHPLIDQINAMFRGYHKRNTVCVFGVWFEIRTLDPYAESWATERTRGMDLYAVSKNKQAPVVAAALVGIGQDNLDIKPVATLFKIPKDMPAPRQKLLLENELMMQDWLRLEVFRWLNHPAQHPDLVASLYDEYVLLDEERNKALGELSPLSKTTLTGPSSNT